MTEKCNLHDDEDFQKFARKGGLFDVGPNELDDDIGHHARFPEDLPSQFPSAVTSGREARI